jgi:hypothetical protein
MIVKILAAIGAAAVAVSLTACGPQQSAVGAPSDENQAAVTPSAASQPQWQSGGRFTGQWPPTQSPPAQWAVKNLGTEKDGQGYSYRITAAFGPALHYGVPHQGIDCNLSQTYSIDLPPGQYEVPFRVTATNLLGQQAPWSLGPLVDTGSVQSTGTGGSALTWDDGACQENVYKNLSSGGTAVAYGVIGPATANELQQVIVTVTAEDAQLLNAPLRTLTPGRALPGS